MSGSRHSLIDPFRFAARGVLAAAASQRNMRLHLVAAVLVATFGSAFPLGIAEQLALLSSVFLVVAAEVLNTALEAAVDLAGGRPDERARLAKDAAAGAVLVLSVGAAAVFALVVAHNWELLRSQWREAAGALALGLSLATLSAWLVFPFPRPRRLDWLAALGGGALVLPLALVSKSLVFTGVASLALALCATAAFARRPGAAEQGASEASRDPLALDSPAAFPVRSPVDGERPDAINPAALPPRRPAR
jgi:diacylglycerol kinase (ATP)